MYLSGLMVSNLDYNFDGAGSFPEGAEKKFAFQFWY